MELERRIQGMLANIKQHQQTTCSPREKQMIIKEYLINCYLADADLGATAAAFTDSRYHTGGSHSSEEGGNRGSQQGGQGRGQGQEESGHESVTVPALLNRVAQVLSRSKTRNRGGLRGVPQIQENSRLKECAGGVDGPSLDPTDTAPRDTDMEVVGAEERSSDGEGEIEVIFE